MGLYQLPAERYKELKELCLQQPGSGMIEHALKAMDCPGLEIWMRRHVTSNRWKWQRLEASGVPCSGDSFRLARAKFFYYLDAFDRAERSNNAVHNSKEFQ